MANRKTKRVTTMDAKLFDFTDTSDLPEDLAKKVSSKSSAGAAHAAKWAEIVNNGAAHGMPQMTINQIIAVASRAGYDIPKATDTVRAYLKKAIAGGLISKPSRQTYGPANASTKAESTGLEDAVATSDVLDDLGLSDELADI